MHSDWIGTEILTLFPQIQTSDFDREISLIKNNLYGFAKALIKAKLEDYGDGDGDSYASKGREIQNYS